MDKFVAVNPAHSLANKFSNSLSVLDLFVFEGRNKEYGAFQLRKNYLSNIAKALGISCLVFILIILCIFYYVTHKKEDIYVYKSVDYKTTDFSIEDIQIPKLAIEKAPEKPKNETTPKENLPPRVTEQQKETVPDQEKSSQNTTSTGTSTSESKTDAHPIKSFSTDTVGTELYTDEIFMKVETSAEFPGGKVAFEKFISDNIVFPPYALNNKIKGLIYVHMVVNRDGTITDLKLYKGIEQSCNDEVLRVMNLSPNWIPARKEGKAVRQRLIVPVKFETP